jgi:hypothetical protein
MLSSSQQGVWIALEKSRQVSNCPAGITKIH